MNISNIIKDVNLQKTLEKQKAYLTSPSHHRMVAFISIYALLIFVTGMAGVNSIYIMLGAPVFAGSFMAFVFYSALVSLHPLGNGMELLPAYLVRHYIVWVLLMILFDYIEPLSEALLFITTLQGLIGFYHKLMENEMDMFNSFNDFFEDAEKEAERKQRSSQTYYSEYSSSGETDYFAEWKASPDKTKSSLQKAYRNLAKKYHPDCHPEKEKEKWEEIIKIIGNQYTDLLVQYGFVGNKQYN